MPIIGGILTSTFQQNLFFWNEQQQKKETNIENVRVPQSHTHTQRIILKPREKKVDVVVCVKRKISCHKMKLLTRIAP